MPSSNSFLPALYEALGLLALSAAIVLGLQLLPDTPGLLEPVHPSDAPGVRTIDLDEARALQESGTAVFIDVRDALDYMDSHLPGAGSLPLDTGRQQGKPLQVIIYCSDASCGKAATMAAQMAESGLEILVLPDGAAGWAQSGGMMEMSQ